MLDLCEISKHFRIGTGLLSSRQLTAVDRVSLQIGKGEFFSLVGESGCGKSTLARIVCGLDAPSAGYMIIDGARIDRPESFKNLALRQRVQMVFQDPYSSLNPRMRMRAILEEPLVSFGWTDKSGINRRIDELLSIIGFPRETLDRYPHQFSGGQRQRIAIARALAAGPDLLICDEPVSALDVSIKGQIINLLLEIQQQLGVTVLFISHDLSLVEKISDRVGVMYLGALVEVGTARQVFDNPRHPYTRLLIESIPSTDPRRRRAQVPGAGELPSPFAIPTGCRFRDRCRDAIARCANEAPALAAVRDGRDHHSACHLSEALGEAGARHPPRVISGIELFSVRSTAKPTRTQPGEA